MIIETKHALFVEVYAVLFILCLAGSLYWRLMACLNSLVSMEKDPEFNQYGPMMGSKGMKIIEEKSPSPFGTLLESNGLGL
ncbi:transmembrane protein, putative [Medicago truncatula]|uniref:Transmembrane protein, putative n=1 Tax=Medicago truncatula TaxID=3880 RepID=A0A072TG62_MEDTR|nr:transmembrane protein, putative [Medicago truncatula]